MLFAVPLGTIGEMQFFLILVNQFFEQNASFLWAKEQKSNSLKKKSESLPLLSRKEWGSLFCNEQREQFAFGHWKGENCEKLSKSVKNIQEI